MVLSLLSSIDNHYEIDKNNVIWSSHWEEYHELLSLLLNLNPLTQGKKYVFWKEFDDHIAFNNIDKQKSYQEVINNCRRNILIMKELCKYFKNNYPHPIPEVLFFVCTGNNSRDAVELANKWLMDCLSGESFLKRNREYFTIDDVKIFLKCDSKLIEDSMIFEEEEALESHLSFRSLIKYYFLCKIPLDASYRLKEIMEIFSRKFEGCFTNSLVIEFISFINNNKENLPDMNIIQDICDYLKDVHGKA